MNLPKISIITPSFNQATFIEATLRSIIEQEYGNLEYIVMDGGSTDGSVDIIKKYSHRIAYWQSKRDAGQSDAIQRGFERATGDIFGWINSDDLLLPGSLAAVGRYFADHPDIDCVIGGSVLIDGKGAALHDKRGFVLCDYGTQHHFHKLLFWTQSGFHQPAAFWRREAFFAIGGLDTSLHFAFDFDMFLRLAKRKPFGRLKEFLAAFRLHGESKTSTIQHVRNEEDEKIWVRNGRYQKSALYRKSMFSLYRNWERTRTRWLKIQLFLGIKKWPAAIDQGLVQLHGRQSST
jgi:glycosyltransferase involved in cell wall biosynthesis